MSNDIGGKKLYDRNNDKLKAQDEILEDIIVSTDNAKRQNQEMGKEIHRQDGMMKDMKTGMNRVDTKMRRINTKIGSLIQQQSYYKLYTIIVLELLVMLLCLL
jgi:hypothetical protein